MFGLLRYKKITIDQYKQFRLNYCGTCKTIAKIYGQKERIFLNFDTVFLSEMLDAISSDSSNFKYITPNTCFSLPKHISQIPFFLKYTASVNILLAYYKIEDNIVDSRSKINIWKTFRHVEKKNFKKAKYFLEQAGVSINVIEECIKKQFAIEKNETIFSDFNETFKYYCNLTGIITGEIFRASVTHLKNDELQKTFMKIGNIFGEIIYLIDALEDYNQDKKAGSFNCLLLDKKLSIISKHELASSYIYKILKRLRNLFELLPIKKLERDSFYERISTNIYSRLNKNIISKTKCLKRNYSIKERYNSALKVAKNIYSRKPNKNLYKILYPVITFGLIWFFLLLPTLAHAQFQEAGCCGSWCCPCSGEEGGHTTGQKMRQCCTDCDKNPGRCCTGISYLGSCLLLGWCCTGCALVGNSGGGRKVITVTKIVEVDKCGCK